MRPAFEAIRQHLSKEGDKVEILTLQQNLLFSPRAKRLKNSSSLNVIILYGICPFCAFAILIFSDFLLE
jgi:hypothetical protein